MTAGVGPEVLAEIEAEAERIRHDGSLPVGFEGDLAARFAAIAADPGALEAEVARRSSAAALVPGGSRPGTPAARVVHFGHRAARAARRRVGPRIRVVERRTVEAAARFGESLSTSSQVAADRARRTIAGSRVERIGGRVGAARRGGAVSTPRGVASSPTAIRVGTDGHLGDEELDRLLMDRVCGTGEVAVERRALEAGRVLHTESGDGALVRRLRALSVDASGAEPLAQASTAIERRGALEALSKTPVASLGALVLTGIPDRVTPASARALAGLAARALAPGGRFVLLSANPQATTGADPIASDLSTGRSLHPVTWCHLFARLGLEAIAVRESADGTAYAVTARREGPP